MPVLLASKVYTAIPLLSLVKVLKTVKNTDKRIKKSHNAGLPLESPTNVLSAPDAV